MLPSPFLNEEASLAHKADFCFAGLRLEVRTETPKHLPWVTNYFAPFFTDQPAVSRAWTQAAFALTFVHSDETVAWASDMIANRTYEETPGISTGRILRCLRLDSGERLLFAPHEGTVILIDPQERRFQVAHGSKTAWPADILCSVMEEILIRYLEGNSWCAYHAGAVATPQGVVLLMGGGGSGKTTLVGGLVRAGAAYVANERCFVRTGAQAHDRLTPSHPSDTELNVNRSLNQIARADSRLQSKPENGFDFRRPALGVEALPFPQFVNVGIGTARQFPPLSALVADRTGLAFHQRRFSQERVNRTPLEDQDALPDKLSLSAREFAHFAGGPEPSLGGPVIGIVEPNLDLQMTNASWYRLRPDDLAKLVEGNSLERGRDRHYPNWLGLSFPPAPTETLALAALPAGRLTFLVEPQGFRGLPDPIGLILSNLLK
ncbi:MAG: hypothetical protein EPN26_07565 [Rhodospirillales bacterium]|nr:MAG: hypothetical protein EPN26_07565 [Rhodospirillales bacterium]